MLTFLFPERTVFSRTIISYMCDPASKQTDYLLYHPLKYVEARICDS